MVPNPVLQELFNLLPFGPNDDPDRFLPTSMVSSWRCFGESAASDGTFAYFFGSPSRFRGVSFVLLSLLLRFLSLLPTVFVFTLPVSLAVFHSPGSCVFSWSEELCPCLVSLCSRPFFPTILFLLVRVRAIALALLSWCSKASVCLSTSGTWREDSFPSVVGTERLKQADTQTRTNDSEKGASDTHSHRFRSFIQGIKSNSQTMRCLLVCSNQDDS